MLLFVTLVSELRLNINDLLDCCNHYKCLIAMDFVMGLPRTQSGYASIWVIVNRLTKVAHFILVKTTYSGPQLAEFYMLRLVCLHGVSKKIVSDRGTQFILIFLERLHEALDTQLYFSFAYHPQTDG
jgi:IS30 family transposase